MEAAVVHITLRLRGSRSLKEKRARVRPVVDRIRHRLHLSVSEVGLQESRDLAELAVAVVGPTVGRVEELLGAAEGVVWAADDLEVIECSRTWLEPDRP